MAAAAGSSDKALDALRGMTTVVADTGEIERGRNNRLCISAVPRSPSKSNCCSKIRHLVQACYSCNYRFAQGKYLSSRSIRQQSEDAATKGYSHRWIDYLPLLPEGAHWQFKSPSLVQH